MWSPLTSAQTVLPLPALANSQCTLPFQTSPSRICALGVCSWDISSESVRMGYSGRGLPSGSRAAALDLQLGGRVAQRRASRTRRPSRAPVECEPPHAGGNADDRLHHRVGVLAPRAVVVGDDDDVPILQVCGVLVAPLAGAHDARRRDQAQVAEAISVLLALDHEHGQRGIGGQQLGQAIEHQSRTTKPPGERAVIGVPSLTELLRLESHGLVERAARLVAVLVDRDLLSEPLTPLRDGVDAIRLGLTAAMHAELGAGSRSGQRPRERSASITSRLSQPVWHLTTGLPLSPSAMDRLGLRSLWAGQRASPLVPRQRPPSPSVIVRASTALPTAMFAILESGRARCLDCCVDGHV
jgi:hypothetical protein